jgi:hypothetical protein
MLAHRGPFRLFLLQLAAATMALSRCLPVEAAQPTISRVLPPGGQRGSDVELVMEGKRLEDGQEILWYDPGIEASGLEPVKGGIKAKVHIASDCPLGEHAFRLRSASGLSELRTFWVGTLPTVMEKEPNNEFAQAQKIDLNVTVTGIITGEDVDCFAVEAKKGQRLSVVVEGLRLGKTLFDPRVAISDSQGRQLALCDDHPLVRQDCITQLIIPANGTYIIQLRDSMFGGNDNCSYRMHVGTFPQPTAVLPLGGKPGEEVDFHFLGDVQGEFTRKIRVPDIADPEFLLYPSDDEGTAAAGIPVRVVDLPSVVATQPHSSMADALSIEIPGDADSVIAKPKQANFYRFSAKKGEVIDINCYARRLRSPLDSVIEVFGKNGKSLANNDDAGGPDSYLRFTAPEDGDYVVLVKDQLGRGGPTSTYRLELTRVAPSMSVNIPKVQQFSQDRQTIVVPRGNRYAARIGVDRKDVGGDVIVSPVDLPLGLWADEQSIAAGVNSGPMVFEADDDAPLSGTLATLAGRSADNNQKLVGGYRQTIELVIGDNQTPFWSRSVSKLAVVVTDEAPFSIDVVEPKVPLVQNGTLQLKIRAQRQADFKAPITLEIIHSAPGVTNASNVTIPEGQTEASFPLNANGKPGYGKWKFAVMGKAQVAGGDVWVSSQLATLEVAQAFVQVAMDRAAGEVGQTAQLVCKIQHTTPFEGTAKAHLFGLPNNVTAPELDLTNDTQTLTFPVAIDPQSPVGRHKGIGCQVVITQNDEPIAQNVSSTELRIDPVSPPKPEKKTASMSQAGGAQVQQLSRLEKLRLDANQSPAESKAEK